MKKILIVSSKEIYTDDLSFFYEIFYTRNYSEAISMLDKNRDIGFGFFEEKEGLDRFLDFIQEKDINDFEFIIGTKTDESSKIRKYFKCGANDVLDFSFESDEMFKLLEEMKDKEEHEGKRYIRELERNNKRLENEIMEYQILYETTKILRLELEFKDIILKLISLVEGLSGGTGYFLLKKNDKFKYYFTKDNLGWTSRYIRKFLKHNGIRKVSEIPDKYPTYYPFEFENKVWHILPIIIKTSLKGYLILIRDSDEMKENIIEVINSVLSQAGIVIENAFLIEETQSMSFEMVKSLVKAIEAKDKYTQGHSQRVAALAGLIGERMEFSPERLRQLEMAAVLHDVGKIGLPEYILNKVGALTEEEYEMIKLHPLKGYEIVSEIQNMREIANIIKHHHERIDGKGYPDKTADIDTPIESRIISVADTYDAMTSDRPYRKGLEHEAAIKEIEKNSGSQFDTDIAKIFLSIDKEVIEKITKK